LKFETGLGLK